MGYFCPELTGFRARTERCCGGLERLRRASGICPAGYCLGGAEVVRRTAPPKPRGSHDEAQIQAEGCNSLDRPKDRQDGTPQPIGDRIVQIARTIHYQARPHYCDAANIGWRDDSISRHRN
jgi:hypothetical protein